MATSMQGLPVACAFLAEVERHYRALLAAVPRKDINPGEWGSSAGGNLLYAGVLDEAGRALVVAGNVAGAATLTATADPAAQKQAIRDGVVDFLVTSLDEAVRILKNEIRKRETVAVCVALEPYDLEREMEERGVAPDLMREVILERRTAQRGHGVLVNWHVAAAPALWLPGLDAMAAECLSGKPAEAQRWLRLAPRYLGRMARGERMVTADTEFAASFSERVGQAVERQEIAVPVTIRICDTAGCTERRFPAAAETIGS
ncbi:MAG: hypothetical protein KGJ51_06760 [Acidobacteriota bacterium]|nr:hypothetical protein [Acidobacteriota bacterium]